MTKIQSFKDLIVWQEAMNLVEMIYRETKQYPKEEIYGLTSQTRRAAVSIPANIAEGYGRKNRKELKGLVSNFSNCVKLWQKNPQSVILNLFQNPLHKGDCGSSPQ
jgi:hypothetical protein